MRASALAPARGLGVLVLAALAILHSSPVTMAAPVRATRSDGASCADAIPSLCQLWTNVLPNFCATHYILAPYCRQSCGACQPTVHVIDGDGIVSHAQFLNDFGTGSDRGRRGLSGYKQRRWTDAVVPYSVEQLKFDLARRHGPSAAPKIHTELLVKLRAAMDHIESETPVRFRPATKDDKHVLEVISGYSDSTGKIVGKGSWCWADIGSIQGTPSNVLGTWSSTPKPHTPHARTVNMMNLDSEDSNGHCWKFSTIVHELGHVLGMYHEQQRSDRDTYLSDYTGPKLQKGAGIWSGNSLGVPYDLLSTMHYPMRLVGGKLTGPGQERLKSQNGGILDTSAIGQKDSGLSVLDAKQLSMLYFDGNVSGTYAVPASRTSGGAAKEIKITAANTPGTFVVESGSAACTIVQDKSDPTKFAASPQHDCAAELMSLLVQVTLNRWGNLAGLLVASGTSSGANAATNERAYDVATLQAAWHPSNCPMYADKHPDTCWGNTAHQVCPADRSGAYHAVMKHRGNQKAMHDAYVRLTATGVGCTMAGRARMCSSSPPSSAAPFPPGETKKTLKSFYVGHTSGGSGKARSCEAMCRSDAKCRSWMWRNSGNTCYLSTDAELAETANQRDHHASTFNEGNCARYLGTKMVGQASTVAIFGAGFQKRMPSINAAYWSFADGQRAGTTSACRAACDAEAACHSAIRYHSNARCYLFGFHLQDIPAGVAATGFHGNTANFHVLLKGVFSEAKQ